MLLTSSGVSDWTPYTPSEVIAILDRELSSLRASSQLTDVAELKLMFAPTAPIQEISMANDWTEKYLVLSQQFDEAVREFQ